MPRRYAPRNRQAEKGQHHSIILLHGVNSEISYQSLVINLKVQATQPLSHCERALLSAISSRGSHIHLFPHSSLWSALISASIFSHCETDVIARNCQLWQSHPLIPTVLVFKDVGDRG